MSATLVSPRMSQPEFGFAADTNPAEIAFERSEVLGLLSANGYAGERGLRLANRIATIERLPLFQECNCRQLRDLRTGIRAELSNL